MSLLLAGVLLLSVAAHDVGPASAHADGAAPDPTPTSTPVDDDSAVYEGLRLSDDGSFSITQVVGMGTAERARDQEGRRHTHSNWRPTGRFAHKGDEITFAVDSAGVAVSAVIGLIGAHKGLNDDNDVDVTEPLALATGASTSLTADRDGMIFVTTESSSGRVAVTVTGGEPVPTFIKGTTTNDDFARQLKQFPDAPMFTVVGDRIFGDFQAVTRAFLPHDMESRIESFDHVVRVEEGVSLLLPGATGTAYNNRHRVYIASPDKGGGYANASSRRIMFQVGTGAAADLFRDKPSEMWALWHEIGHTFQTASMTWFSETEVAVNIYSLAVQRTYGVRNRIDTNAAKEVQAYFAQPVAERDFAGEKNVLISLLMFDQLTRAFGENFMPQLHQELRVALALGEGFAFTDAQKLPLFALSAAKVTHRNLNPFFVQWGIHLEESTIARLEGFPALTKPIWENLDSTAPIEEELLPPLGVPIGKLSPGLDPVIVARHQLKTQPAVAGLGVTGGEGGGAKLVSHIVSAPTLGTGRLLAVLQSDRGVREVVTAPITVKAGESIQFQGISNRDVFWVSLDPDRRLITGDAFATQAAHGGFGSDEYVALELRDEKDTLLASEVVTGSENALMKARTIAWPYRNGYVLVARHQEAGARLTAYSAGTALPRMAAKSQRFMIENDRLVRDLAAISSGSPAHAQFGKPYSHQFVALGSGASEWTVSAGSLPSGLSLDKSTGLLAGTPTAVASSSFAIRVTNLAGTAEAQYTMIVAADPPVFETTALPNGHARGTYSEVISASNAAGATWALVAGSLPVGLELDSGTGRISGVPTRVGVSEFTIAASTAGGTGKARFSITVAAGSPILDDFDEAVHFEGYGYRDAWWVALDGKGAVVGFAENDVATHTGFASEYLAVELRDATDNLLHSAVVKGTESASAAAEAMKWPYKNGYVLVVRHQEAATRLTVYSGGQALPKLPATTQRFVIHNDRLLRDVAAITSAAPAPAKVGSAYTHQLVGTGTGAPTWSVSKGALPAGLTLEGSTGLLSGTPTAVGTSTFTVQLANRAGVATADYTVAVVSATVPVITAGELPEGRRGAPYSHRFTATNAEGGEWRSTMELDIPGITLDPTTGVLSGTPSRAAATRLTVTVTTAAGVATADFTLIVASNLADTYPNAIQFSGHSERDVLWVGVDPSTKHLIGVATDDADANRLWSGEEYLAVELRDEHDALLQSAQVNGDANAVEIAARLRWAYQEGWTLVTRHQEAAARLTMFSDGKPQPREDLKTQRFRIIGDHLVREGVTVITAPKDGATVVPQPVIRGVAIAGMVVQLTALSGTHSTMLGTAVADSNGRWEFSVPAATRLPVGAAIISATMPEHPAPVTARVTITVGEIPPARLTMTAHVQRVVALPGRAARSA